ncbi:MAG: hypothetical protein AABZ10_06320 [Nitrospirota bacterium]
MKKSLLASGIVALAFFFSAPLSAEELEMVNRPVNAAGLTGLLFTSTPYVLPPKTVEIGAGVLSENSAEPHYSLAQYRTHITIGISPGMELAVKGSYSRREISPPMGITEHEMGDTEVSWKWNFRPQKESSAFPALAMIITGIAPTSDEDKELNNVVHWGSRLGISAGREIVWDEHVLGIYAETQVAVQDLSDPRYRDRYSVTNAGMLFPISKYRNLQLLVEYTVVSGRDVHTKSNLTPDDMDYTAVTYGIRLVSEKFNLTMGTQLLHKEEVEVAYKDSSRVIGMMSIKF